MSEMRVYWVYLWREVIYYLDLKILTKVPEDNLVNETTSTAYHQHVNIAFKDNFCLKCLDKGQTLVAKVYVEN